MLTGWEEHFYQNIRAIKKVLRRMTSILIEQGQKRPILDASVPTVIIRVKFSKIFTSNLLSYKFTFKFIQIWHFEILSTNRFSHGQSQRSELSGFFLKITLSLSDSLFIYLICLYDLMICLLDFFKLLIRIRN